MSDSVAAATSLAGDPWKRACQENLGIAGYGNIWLCVPTAGLLPASACYLG